MRSAVFFSKGDVRTEEVPELETYGDSILVDVEWCGLCGTDLHLYQLGLSVALRSSSVSLRQIPSQVWNPLESLPRVGKHCLTH